MNRLWFLFIIYHNLCRMSIIKKGTVMFVDGEKVEIKKDLNIRFKKIKVTVCKCDEVEPSWVVGHCFNNIKDFAQSDFENNLLEAYKTNKRYFSKIIGK